MVRSGEGGWQVGSLQNLNFKRGAYAFFMLNEILLEIGLSFYYWLMSLCCQTNC